MNDVGDVSQQFGGDVDIQRARQGFPTGNAVDLDDPLAPIATHEHIDAGEDGADRRGGTPRELCQGLCNFEERAGGAAADVRPPIGRMTPPHTPHLLPQYQEAQVASIVLDESLLVNYRPHLLEHLECSHGEFFIADARNAALPRQTTV